MKFSYIRFGLFHKPVVRAIFVNGETRLGYEVLLDTGADLSILHVEFAQKLRINLEEGTKMDFFGIAGNGYGYLHRVDIRIAAMTFNNVPVLFTRDIDPDGLGILGHEGLFDKMKLIF